MPNPADEKLACPGCGLELEVSALMRERVEARVRESVGAQLAAEHARRLRDKDAELAAKDKKLAEAARHEADLLKRQRQLAEREQQLELENERTIATELERIRAREAEAARERAARDAATRIREVELAADQRVADATAKARDDYELHDAQHKEQIDSMQRTIRELQRKAEQTTQQLHGEAQEVALRDRLVDAFPFDEIEDVPRGMRGADVIHRVRAPDGLACDTIIWESKRAKTWTDAWIAKLRDDQRDTRAAVAVIVTQVMPRGTHHFELVEGVWVCHWSYAIALAHVLRAGMIEVSRARRAAEGRGEKIHKLYDYLTGPDFRTRVTGLLAAITDMRADLERERRTMKSSWARREKQIERAQDNVTAFAGDLQGIAGGRLIELPALDLADPPHELDDDEVQGSLLP